MRLVCLSVTHAPSTQSLGRARVSASDASLVSLQRRGLPSARHVKQENTTTQKIVPHLNAWNANLANISPALVKQNATLVNWASTLTASTILPAKNVRRVHLRVMRAQ